MTYIYHVLCCGLKFISYNHNVACYSKYLFYGIFFCRMLCTLSVPFDVSATLSDIHNIILYHGPLARYVKLRVRMRRECRERFPRHRRWAIPTCITARASRTCRDACRDRQLAVSFEIGGGENVPGIPGACATCNFTYLVRGPWHDSHFTATLDFLFVITHFTVKRLK